MSTSTNGGGLAASVNNRASAAYSYAQRTVDRVAPPSSRQRAYDAVSEYASRRPILFSLLATHAVLTSFFLLAFAAFTLSTFALAVGAAVLFTLFWMGVAFIFLIPLLLAASCTATLVWAWAVASFLVIRFLYVRSPLAGDSSSPGNAGTKSLGIVKPEGGKLDGAN